MWLCCIVLVGLVALLDTSAVANPNVLTTDRSNTMDRSDATIRQMLRTEHTADEERGITTPNLDKLKTMLTVSQQKLDSWLLGGNSADDVFARLQLAQAGDKLLDKPDFVAWVKYVDDLSAKNPGKAVSTIPTLTAQYGDEALFKLLETAKKSAPSSDSLASRLQAEQIQNWLVMKKSPRAVFKIFGLQKAGDDFFSNPLLNTWLNYLKDFRRKNPQTQTYAYSALAKYDADVLTMAAKAMNTPSTAKNAERVQSEILRSWMTERSPPSSVFFHLLGRDRSTSQRTPDGGMRLVMDTDNFLIDPSFKVWAKYLNDFNKNYPDKKTNMVKSLLADYSDDTLSRALLAAKLDPKTEKLATNLQLSLLNKWAQDKKSPTEVAKLFNLKATDPLVGTYTKKFDWVLRNVKDKELDDLNLETGLRYLADFKAKNPGSGMSDINILTTRYGDEALAKILVQLDSSSSLYNTGVTLELAMRRAWLNSGKSPDDVFKLLKLDEAGAGLLESPVFRTLGRFVQFFNKKNPSGRVATLDILRKAYGDEALSKIFIEATRAPSTKVTLAQSWQKKLLGSWLEERKSPKDVLKWLQVKKLAPDSAEALLYQQYWSSYKSKFGRANGQ